MTCPKICNPDIGSYNSSVVVIDDQTNVQSADCQDLLLLTTEDGGGLIGVDTRVRVLTSVSEAKQYFLAGGEVVRAATDYFANTTREIKNFFKVAYIAPAETVTQALEAIKACDNCWLGFTSTHDLQATASFDLDAAFWATANDKMYFFVSSSPANENPSDATSPKALLAAQNLENAVMIYTKGQCEVVRDPITGEVQLDVVTGEPITETVVKYHNLLAGGLVCGNDMGVLNANYNFKFKPRNNVGWVGVEVDSLTFSQVVAVTGEQPDGTISQNNNGYGNVFIKSMGFQAYTSGKTVTGAWIDEVHLKVYLKRQLQAAAATLFSQAKSVPYDDARGRNLIANALAGVMRLAQRNGLFSNDTQDFGGVSVRKGTAWIVRADSFAVQPAARQNQRLAPVFETCYVPAGSTNFIPILLCVRLSGALSNANPSDNQPDVPG